MRRLVFVVSGVLAAAVALAVWVWPAPHARSSTGPVFSLAARLPALSRAGLGSLGEIEWNERVYTASTGEPVDVSVSASYPVDDQVGQQWADFFASLLHGPELRLLRAHVAPLPEVQAICGARAVGCYGDDQLIVTNEPALGFAPDEVARHEYGHHIARNGLNSPWPAIDWGPKRWATSAKICGRVRSRTAYPGDEFLLYRLNPGEAFAEAYRVLIDRRRGQTRPSWPLVDPSFYPDSGTLAAIEQDVVSPWVGPTTRRLHVHIPDGSRSVRAQRVATPLDGTLTVRITLPTGSRADLALLTGNGRTVLATAHATRGRIMLGYRVCGQRSITIRLTVANSRGRDFDLEVTTP
jgi:hypothetical protein